MFNRARIRSDFNEAAPHYDAHASLQKHVLAQLCARLGILPADAMLLDAGCGTGILARTLKRKNIIALDHAHGMCVQAKHSGNLPVNADMGALPFADNSFDVIFSSLALQWSLNWKATLHEWLRVLKPSGTLAFSTLGAGTLYELAASFCSVDNHKHVSDFINADDITRYIPASIESKTVTEYYLDVMALARHLKALGARNKEQGQRPTLMTPRQLQRVHQHYARTYGSERGLPVSWNILYATVKKP